MEEDYLFKSWCNANNKPSSFSELLESLPAQTPTNADEVWESQLKEYHEYSLRNTITAGSFKFGIKKG